MPNQYKGKWTQKEVDILYEYQEPGVTIEHLFPLLPKRTYEAIRTKLKVMGIKKGKMAPKKTQTPIARPDINIKPPKKGYVAIIGDDHVPFQDPKIVEIQNEFLSDLKPKIIVHGGDLLDFNEISKFRRVPFNRSNLEEDIHTAHCILRDIREAAPQSSIYLIEGNHEFRWRANLLDYAPALYGSYYHDLPKMLNLKDIGITYIPCEQGLSKFSDNYVRIGKYHIGHFDMARKHAGYTAKGLREEKGVDVIQLHVHRAGMSPRTYLDGVKLGAEVGCRCKLNPAYMSNPDWQHGVGVIEFDKGVSNFYNIIIDNHKFVWRGKTYK